MDLQTAIALLAQIITHKLRHQDYARVLEIKKDFSMYTTGVGIEEKLKRFHGGETEEMFTQRKKITIVNTRDLVNSCVKPLVKVGRTAAAFDINWQEADTETINKNKKKILDAAKTFWGNKSVKNYLTKRVPSYDKCDPNAWMVVEFKGAVDNVDDPTEKLKPYPFEVSCEEAIHFLHINDILQYLFVLNSVLVPDGKEGQITGEKYFCYLANHNVTSTEIHRDYLETWKTITQWEPLPTAFETLAPNKNYLLSLGEGDNKRYFFINVFETKLGFVPAFRFGTETDEQTNHRTCVPVIYPAQSYFEDSIQVMSEFSTTKRLHTFPQKWQYLPKCHDCHGNGKDRKKPTEGCKSCNGSGTITHSSSQDVIGIKMPDELKDVINIDLLSTYKAPPIDLLKFQKEFGFEDIRRYAQAAVYASEVGKRRVKTATESEIDYEAVYDTIKAYADHWSDMFVFIYRVHAVLYNIEKGIEITHQFPDDFQMQTIGEILDDLKKANETGASSYVKKALNKKLITKVYLDQPSEVVKIETKDKFYPFSGKTPDEINFILANGKTLRRVEVLYIHFNEIFSEIEYEHNEKQIDFYQLEEGKQREAIKIKVDEYIKLMDTEAAIASSNAFATGADIDTPVDVEAEAKAKLKGSVGGVQGIIEIQTSVANGTTDIEAGVAMLSAIYGYDEETAKRMIGKPKKITQPAPGGNID